MAAKHALLLLLLLFFQGCTAEERSITVFAASSLREAFSEVAQRFEEERGVKVELNFAGSNTLRLQIEQGGKAEVFASASEEHMRALVERGLVRQAVPFAGNRLVLVVPASNPAGIKSVQDLAEKELRLVLANEAVPAGKYAREALYELEASYGEGFAERVLSHAVSSEDSVRGVLAKVALGEADAGFVYYTDALAAGERVRVIELPQVRVRPRYYAGVLASAEHSEAAEAFIAFLLSPEGRQILKKHGFEVVG